MATRAFLSFVEEDLATVNLFRGQAKNQATDLEFADYSVKIPFNSTNTEYIKQQITAQIKPSTLAVCLYGPTTHESQWVNWELQKTLDLGKPIMGVNLFNDGRTRYFPAPLNDWPRVNWDVAAIVSTMERLAAQYRRG